MEIGAALWSGLNGRLDLRALAHRASLFVAGEWCGRWLFRLCFGRLPDEDERRSFALALRDFRSPLPIAVRAMKAVPACRTLVSELLLSELQSEGRLPPQESVGGVAWSVGSQVGDPLSFWDGPPVSFMHVEKTAGTALASALARRFHPLQIDADPNRSMPPHVRSAFPTPALAGVCERKLVWGHYDLPSLRRLGSQRLVVTMLREPRGRILSLYYYWRSVRLSSLEDFQNTEVRLAHQLDLLAFLQSDELSIRNSIDNVYARRLTGRYAMADGPDALAADGEGTLRMALRGLDTIAFVGVVERMDESLDKLSAALKTTLRVERDNDGIENASAHPALFRPVERAEPTAAIAAELDRLTSLDRLIYASCLARLDGAEDRRAA